MTKQIKAFQLHDSESEEILGTVFIDSDSPTQEDEDFLFEAWEEFNKLEEYEGNTSSVEEFIHWFSEEYGISLGVISIDFIQPQ